MIFKTLSLISSRHHLLPRHDNQPPKKVKVAHTRLPSVGFRSWSRFSAVSLQVASVINSAVGCHSFARPAVTPATLKRAATNFAVWWQWVWTVCLRLLPDCDLNPGPSAPESRTLTTQLHLAKTPLPSRRMHSRPTSASGGLRPSSPPTGALPPAPPLGAQPPTSSTLPSRILRSDCWQP